MIPYNIFIFNIIQLYTCHTLFIYFGQEIPQGVIMTQGRFLNTKMCSPWVQEKMVYISILKRNNRPRTQSTTRQEIPNPSSSLEKIDQTERGELQHGEQDKGDRNS
jgi:hypothetical protein